jgi:MFS family permease
LTSWSPYAKLIREKNFAALLTSSTLASTGAVFLRVAAAWLVFTSTGSAFAVGLLFVAQTAPNAAFGLIAGTYLDKWNKRRTMIYTYLARAALIVLLALSLYRGTTQIAVILSFVAALSLASAFSHPARHAIIPEIVGSDELPFANGLLESTGDVAELLIYGTSIVTLIVLGAIGTILVSGLTFLLAAVSIVPITGITNAVETGQLSVGSGMKELITFLSRSPTIRILLIAFLPIDFFFTVATAFPIVYASAVLHIISQEFGLLLAALTFGQILGYLIAGRVVKGKSVGRSLLFSPLLFGAAIVLLSINTSLGLALGLFIAAGLSTSVYDITLMSFFQATTPKRLMGRVVSTYIVISLVAGSIAGAVAGSIADAIGLPATYLISGLGIATVAVLLLSQRRIKEASF